MDMLEQNLEQLRQSFGDNMTLNVVIHLGLQMIEIIEAIHNKGIIHRDIKPANFLLKTNQQNITELYLIDFGISRCFYIDNDKKDTHIAIKTNEELLGTTRYMSVHTHQGLTASRRDDLESVGYILIYLHKGELPWQNAGEMALSIKQTMGWAYSINVVGEFILFIQYCRNLPFAAKPNYAYLRTILTNLSTIL
jgi:casein kinase I family protein HRR25